MQLVEGAKQAKGLTVIIDVFRAFTTACYVMGNGAEKIIPVGDIGIAYRLKAENPDFILMGEREGIIQAGFDYGNSPTHIENLDFTDKTIVLTTSAGTQGIVNAKNAEEIITGSFVNAQAIVNYIKTRKPKHLSLVCMGYDCLYPIEEDTLCAEYLRNVLENRPNNMDNIIEFLKSGSGKRFFDPDNKDFSPEMDFHLCMQLNKFNFVLKAETHKEELICLKLIRM